MSNEQFPANPRKEVDKLLGELHLLLQKISTLLAHDADAGVDVLVSSWTVLCDEKFYRDGEYMGCNVHTVKPFEQAPYLTEAHVRHVARSMGLLDEPFLMLGDDEGVE